MDLPAKTSTSSLSRWLDSTAQVSSTCYFFFLLEYALTKGTIPNLKIYIFKTTNLNMNNKSKKMILENIYLSDGIYVKKKTNLTSN